MTPPPALEKLFWRTHIDFDRPLLLVLLKFAIWTPIGLSLVVFRFIFAFYLLPIFLGLSILAPGYVLPVFVRKTLLFAIGICIKYVQLNLVNAVHVIVH